MCERVRTYASMYESLRVHTCVLTPTCMRPYVCIHDPYTNMHESLHTHSKAKKKAEAEDGEEDGKQNGKKYGKGMSPYV